MTTQVPGSDVQAPALRTTTPAGTHLPSAPSELPGTLSERAVLGRRAAVLAAHPDPGAALEAWLDGLIEETTESEETREWSVGELLAPPSEIAPSDDALVSVTEHLLVAAQRDGSARPGVRAKDLHLAVLAVRWAGHGIPGDTRAAAQLQALVHRGWKSARGEPRP